MVCVSDVGSFSAAGNRYGPDLNQDYVVRFPDTARRHKHTKRPAVSSDAAGMSQSSSVRHVLSHTPVAVPEHSTCQPPAR